MSEFEIDPPMMPIKTLGCTNFKTQCSACADLQRELAAYKRAIDDSCTVMDSLPGCTVSYGATKEQILERVAELLAANAQGERRTE